MFLGVFIIPILSIVYEHTLSADSAAAETPPLFNPLQAEAEPLPELTAVVLLCIATISATVLLVPIAVLWVNSIDLIEESLKQRPDLRHQSE